ncbi:MAG: class I SAM-dependent RNA methyltransferase [Candidatus Paracaedimonas acanthamoebae]|uniref:Class I SAM-dependent RNA methyltransferase n=1 Tax=Candidatus Paracaedimonas acanthamoebae TaxID=244581 RepID=A0A8J7PWC1_9PROT|nr:class I SAM-dependent RNA methyltransferase [Candidatus Paracaedimonas acanthamoebae]
MKTLKTTILKLDDRGYGIAQSENRETLIVPYSLPGEKVEIEKVQDRWCVKKIEEVSSERIAPPCPYYETCGGCVLQHMSSSAYADYKMKRLSQAMERHGVLRSSMDPLVILEPHLRRRAIFHALKTASETLIGYYQVGSHHLVDIANCLLLRPEINDLVVPLKRLLGNILKPKEKADIFLTFTKTGIDFLLKVKGNEPLDLLSIEALKTFAYEHSLARISFENDQEGWPIIALKTPQIQFGFSMVEVSADGFLQTSTEADQLLTSLVLEGLPDESGKVADLFCGRGTFTLPLSETRKVDAYEMDGKALKALTQAVKTQQLPIQTYARNLFSDPLTPEHLDSYQSVVLNPPRQGAAAQAKMLALSKVSHVVMISCNPDTFARDVSFLQKGGFRLEKLTPVDQFLWSPHVEIVAHLRR